MIDHQIALLKADSVVSEFKSKLINPNNDLAGELLELRSRTIAISSDVTFQQKPRRTARDRSDSEQANCRRGDHKEELEKLKSAGELGKQTSDQGSVIGNLEENVRGLKPELDAWKGELEKRKVRIQGVDIRNGPHSLSSLMISMLCLLQG